MAIRRRPLTAKVKKPLKKQPATKVPPKKAAQKRKALGKPSKPVQSPKAKILQKKVTAKKKLLGKRRKPVQSPKAKPSPLWALIAANPLPKKSDREKAAKDLAAAAETYAKQAEYTGTEGVWWKVWNAIERERGHKLKEAVQTLNPSARRWFAIWAMDNLQGEEALRPYRCYLDNPGEVGPFDKENAAYLDRIAVLPKVDARQILTVAEEMLAKTTETTAVTLRLLRALATLGEGAAALSRIPAPDASNLHDGTAWALFGIVQARHGDSEKAKQALEMCAKLGCHDKEIVQHLREAFSLDEAAWAALRAPWGFPEEDLHERWLQNRGARPEPTTEPSPHCFGGDDFRLPQCQGCGHPIRQWFLIDITAVPSLRAKLPSWSLLPLLGCNDCALFLFRHDYMVDGEAKVVDLLGVAANDVKIKQFGSANKTEPLIPRQPVALRKIDSSSPPQEDRPQIGGEPDWVQDFERIFCPKCQEEMVFVAAMGCVDKLQPRIMINNGSGYQYHFACDRCRTLSVFAQNT
jgi:hypothetical protein